MTRRDKHTTYAEKFFFSQTHCVCTDLICEKSLTLSGQSKVATPNKYPCSSWHLIALITFLACHFVNLWFLCLSALRNVSHLFQQNRGVVPSQRFALTPASKVSTKFSLKHISSATEYYLLVLCKYVKYKAYTQYPVKYVTSSLWYRLDVHFFDDILFCRLSATYPSCFLIHFFVCLFVFFHSSSVIGPFLSSKLGMDLHYIYSDIKSDRGWSLITCWICLFTSCPRTKLTFSTSSSKAWYSFHIGVSFVAVLIFDST